jgi:hypothetical protein
MGKNQVLMGFLTISIRDCGCLFCGSASSINQATLYNGLLFDASLKSATEQFRKSTYPKTRQAGTNGTSYCATFSASCMYLERQVVSR